MQGGGEGKGEKIPLTSLYCPVVDSFLGSRLTQEQKRDKTRMIQNGAKRGKKLIFSVLFSSLQTGTKAKPILIYGSFFDTVFLVINQHVHPTLVCPFDLPGVVIWIEIR